MLLTFMPPSNSLVSFLDSWRAFWSKTAPFLGALDLTACIASGTSEIQVQCQVFVAPALRSQYTVKNNRLKPWYVTQNLECKRPRVHNWVDDPTWSHPLQPLRHFLQLYGLLRILSASSSKPMCSSLKGGIWMKNSSQDCGPKKKVRSMTKSVEFFHQHIQTRGPSTATPVLKSRNPPRGTFQSSHPVQCNLTNY